MAIAFGTFSGWSGQVGFTVTMPRPGGTANNDFLVMVIATSADQIHVTPAGWALVQNARNGSSTVSSNLSVFYKLAANEPPSYACTVSGNNLLGIGGVFRFTGSNLAVDQTVLNSGSGTALTSNSITPSQTPSCVILANATRAGIFNPTMTPPGGFTEVGEGGFYNVGVEVSYLSYSGTSATGAYTTTANSTGLWADILFNIYEGAGGGGGGGTAASVTFAPVGNVSASNVQAAIAEVSTDAVQLATATTKGDLLAASAGNTIVRVPVGTNGQVLAADSTATGGVSWATPAAGDTTAWTTYTPTMTASPTSPTLGGGGAITGHYKQLGKTLQFQIEVIVGTGPTNGSGTYNFSLPGGVTTVNRNQTCTAWFIDASIGGNAGHYIGVGLVGAAATSVTGYLAGGGVTAPGTPFAGGTPVSLQSGDTFVIGGTIEVQ